MKWINVEDGLPDNTQDGNDFLVVLNSKVYPGIWSAFAASDEERGFYLRNFDTDYGGLFPFEDITHWMPFPEPPSPDTAKT